jgi:hypothetical protein
MEFLWSLVTGGAELAVPQFLEAVAKLIAAALAGTVAKVVESYVDAARRGQPQLTDVSH